MKILLHLNSTILVSLFYVFEDGCCLEPRFRKAWKAAVRVTTGWIFVTVHIWQDPMLLSRGRIVCFFCRKNVPFLLGLHRLDLWSLNVLIQLHLTLVVVPSVCLCCVWQRNLRIALLFNQRERQFINIGKTELLEPEIQSFLFLSHLLRCEGNYEIRVDQLFVLLHHL